ncbi:MAG: methyltransferase domain-containing protein, partial [Alphaproteobacteria bacterium]|nr:methyltransferase domain-containing protein [Alphaproteobacteria bacterium]
MAERIVGFQLMAGNTNFIERRSCPVCGAARGNVLFDARYDSERVAAYLAEWYGQVDLAPLAGIRYTVKKCNECGFVFQVVVPAGAFLEVLYDGWIGGEAREELRDRYVAADYRYLAFQVDWILRYFRKPPREIAVFDFGMGWSEFLEMARAFGCDVAGMELSEKRVCYAQSIGVQTISMDELPEGAFDFINTEQVFEHLAEPRQVLERLARAV